MNVTHAQTAPRRTDPRLAASWLACWRMGMTFREIADECETTRDVVVEGIESALADEPPPPPRRFAEAFFPPDLLVSFGAGCKAKPTCEDVHPRGPIPRGSNLCCFDCHQSGVDDHPFLRIGPDEVPPFEPDEPPDGAGPDGG